MRNKTTLILIGIVIIAFSLRAIGINFGLPYLYHIDEPSYVSAALKLGRGILIDAPYDPTGFVNMIFPEYVAFYIVGRLLDWFHTVNEFEILYRTDPSSFYLISRLTSAFLGTATVLAVYVLGKRLHSKYVGLLAAAFLSVSFAHVRESHFGLPNIAMTFFVTLCVTYCVISLRSNHKKDLLIAGAAGGLAFATKWVTLPIIVPLLWTGVCIWNGQKKEIKKIQQNRHILIILIGFVLGAVVGSLQIILNPTPYLGKLITEFQTSKSESFLGLLEIDNVSGWLFYLKTLWYGLGIILLVLAILGLFRQIISTILTKDKIKILILSFPIVYYILMGSTLHYFARYALPLIPFFVLFAAETISALTIRINTNLNWLKVGLTVFVSVITVAQPLASSVRLDYLLSLTDTRTIALQWIENQIPDGSKIAMDWDVSVPPLSTPKVKNPYTTKTFNVTIIGGYGVSDHSVGWYYQNGYDYLITSSFIYNIPLSLPDKNLERQKFYSSLDEEIKLIKEIRPNNTGPDPSFNFEEIYGPFISLWQRDRPGPTIKIYKLQ